MLWNNNNHGLLAADGDTWFKLPEFQRVSILCGASLVVTRAGHRANGANIIMNAASVMQDSFVGQPHIRLLRFHLQHCSAKPKGSICLLVKWADAAFWLCTADCSSGHKTGPDLGEPPLDLTGHRLTSWWSHERRCSSEPQSRGWRSALIIYAYYIAPQSCPENKAGICSCRISD